MLQQFIQQLCTATPRKSILRWMMMSGLYALSTFLNEHFDFIQSIGLSPKKEALIKLSGLYLYMLLTTYQFQKQKSKQPPKPKQNNNYETPLLPSKTPDMDYSFAASGLDAPEPIEANETGNESALVESKPNPE